MLEDCNPNNHQARSAKALAHPFAPQSYFCETSLQQATQQQLRRRTVQTPKEER
jgi:hypothetical protein